MTVFCGTPPSARPLRVAFAAFALKSLPRRSDRSKNGPMPLQSEPNLEALRNVWQTAVLRSADHLRTHRILTLEATGPGWLDTGIDVEANEEITLFADGTVWLSQELGIGFGAKVALWHRIEPKGEVAKAKSSTTTFKAVRAGRLQLVTKPPGEFLDRAGAFDPEFPRGGASGSLLVAVLVWKGGAADGLAQFVQVDDSGFAARELSRLAKPIKEPNGWHHLWRLGASEIFSQDQHRIHCATDRDVGILQYPVDVALDESVRLQWSWRMTALPSEKAEDTLPTHDYLSIAVEFDNGQDLTYMWSAALPAGQVFRCPLPWWNVRETHKVVRSGTDELGRWLIESQNVLEDYREAVGGVAPKRIVAVWLIAVSLFLGGKGECEYAGIRLHSKKLEAIIGP
jgi:hypothetical protein